MNAARQTLQQLGSEPCLSVFCLNTPYLEVKERFVYAKIIHTLLNLSLSKGCMQSLKRLRMSQHERSLLWSSVVAFIDGNMQFWYIFRFLEWWFRQEVLEWLYISNTKRLLSTKSCLTHLRWSRCLRVSICSRFSASAKLNLWTGHNFNCSRHRVRPGLVMLGAKGTTLNLKIGGVQRRGKNFGGYIGRTCAGAGHGMPTLAEPGLEYSYLNCMFNSISKSLIYRNEFNLIQRHIHKIYTLLILKYIYIHI